MYVCNCNGISESEVEAAVRSGVERWDEVHAYYGCQPCCGQCQCEIVQAMAEHEGAKSEESPFFGTPALAAAG